MARITSELVLSMNDQISGKARLIDRNLDRLEHRQRGAGAAMARNQGLAQKMAGSMGIYAASAAGVAAPLVAGLGAREVITAAADFESALTGIQKKAGTTAAETAKIGEEIKALATSGELAVPIDEIASAYERGAAAGIPLRELREFARLSAMAADAFEMSAEDVGNAAAGFKTSLGVPMNEMERLFDLINGLADAGIADESGIVDFLDRSGAQLKMLGLANEQIAALGATLLNLKMPAEVGARAMNTLSSKMLNPKGTKKSAAAFGKLYGNADEFTELLKEDANGAVLDFLKRLQGLDKFGRTDVLTGILGDGFSDEVNRLVAALPELERNLKFAAGTDWFGSLGKSYDLKLDDFWSKWQLLKNEMGKLTIDLGTAGMPALKSGLQEAVEIVGEIGEGMKSFEARVDWQSFDEAKASVGRLVSEVSRLLNIDTSDSSIVGFFERLAAGVNELTSAIDRVERFLDRSKIKPVEPPKSKTEAEDRRFEALKERVRKDRAKRAWMKDMPAMAWIPDDVIGDRPSGFAMSDYDRQNWDRALRAVEGETQTAPRQARVQRQSSAESVGAGASAQGIEVRSPKPNIVDPLKAEGSAAVAEAENIAARMGRALDVEASPSITPTIDGAAVSQRGIVIPTPRPDIAGPLRAEGDKAALEAEAIGARISNAFSVTAAPTVDASSIRAASRDADALIRKLQQIPGLVERAGAAAPSGKSGRLDMGGHHYGD